MKFEFDIRKCSDVGLVVKDGNSNNVVFFFDENEDAASYSLELYRLDFDMGNNGFLREVCEILTSKEGELYKNGNYEKYINESLSVPNQPYFQGDELISQHKWNEMDTSPYSRRGSQIERCELIKYPFDEVKPICSISIDRNTFFASVDFLPEGEYICILNVEDRNGEIIKRSVPYYFKIKANADISKQLAGIQSSVRSSGRHVVTNS
jgi:hypothetical protein